MKRILKILMVMAVVLPAQASVKIALVGNFPGGKGLEADASAHAIEHAVQDLENGIPNLKLKVVDDGGNLTAAAKAASQIIADSSIKGVIIHGETSAAAEILKSYRDADIAVIAASSWIEDRGDDGHGATWLAPTQQQMARIAARYAHKARRLKQVAVLDNSSPTSVAAADAFVKRFKSLGGRVVFRGEWQGSHWGMTRTVKALKANWPQAVYVPLEPEASGRLVKRMKKKGMDACILIGGPRLFEQGFFKQGRTHTRGSVGITAMPDYRGRAILRKHTGISYAKNSAHWKAYYNFAWKRPHRWTSMVFDGVTLMVRAMRNAASDTDLEGELPEKKAPEDVVKGDGDLPTGSFGRPVNAVNGAARVVTDAAGATPTAVVKPAKRRKWKGSRKDVREALNKIQKYRGIRGRVTFDKKREPKGAKAMVFQALPKVNSKWMQWWDYKFGPPF